MSAMNKISRLLIVLVVMAILAVLVWKLAVNTNYFYLSIGIAVLITIGVIVAVYHTRSASGNRSKNRKKSRKPEHEDELVANTSEENPEASDLTAQTMSVEIDAADSALAPRNKSESIVKNETPKPNAIEVVARYRQMAAEAAARENDSNTLKPASKLIQPQDSWTVSGAKEDEPEKTAAQVEANSDTEPPLPLIDDQSKLTEEDKNELVNAVWYRCENPFCKYTNFLSVHHIVDEKDGGTNKLDNLIVLCPYCHDLAHKNEIPVDEMRKWIGNREERFRFKPEWHYI